MDQSSAPSKLTIPFANAGGKNTIPTASQIGITPGAASYADGFPPLTRTPLAAGGTPPSGLDMNGILYDLSAAARWALIEGGLPFDATFAAAIGGYPRGARCLMSSGNGYWVSLVNNNTTNPDTNAQGWAPMWAQFRVRALSAATTLTANDVGRLIVVTASATITLPAGGTVASGHRISFMATTAGSATIQRQGSDLLLYKNSSTVTSLTLGSADTLDLEWDGANWLIVGGTAQLQYAAAFGATLAATGQQILPSGLIIKWGPTPTVAGNSSASVTFSSAFPNAVYGWVPMGGKVATGQGSTLISGGLTVSGGTLTNTGANQVDAGVYLAWGR